MDFEETKLIQAINRRGRTISLRLHRSPLRSPSGAIRGGILLMETAEDG